MIVYRVVPYLVVAAPPAIVLLTILIGGCTMTRTTSDPVVASIPVFRAALLPRFSESYRQMTGYLHPADLHRAASSSPLP